MTIILKICCEWVLSDRTFVPHSFHSRLREHRRRQGAYHIPVCSSIPRRTYGQHKLELENYFLKKHMKLEWHGDVSEAERSWRKEPMCV